VCCFWLSLLVLIALLSASTLGHSEESSSTFASLRIFFGFENGKSPRLTHSTPRRSERRTANLNFRKFLPSRSGEILEFLPSSSYTRKSGRAVSKTSVRMDFLINLGAGRTGRAHRSRTERESRARDFDLSLSEPARGCRESFCPVPPPRVHQEVFFSSPSTRPPKPSGVRHENAISFRGRKISSEAKIAKSTASCAELEPKWHLQ
jgi:hypothetical protein